MHQGGEISSCRPTILPFWVQVGSVHILQLQQSLHESFDGLTGFHIGLIGEGRRWGGGGTRVGECREEEIAQKRSNK